MRENDCLQSSPEYLLPIREALLRKIEPTGGCLQYTLEMVERELQKIEEYFKEGSKLWSANPDFVVSRHFFELWEKVQQPRPFALRESQLNLAGMVCSLVQDENQIGCFVWDAQEHCSCFYVEGEQTKQKIQIFFEHGIPVLQELPPVFLDTKEIGFGERQEVIYDFLSFSRKKGLDNSTSAKEDFYHAFLRFLEQKKSDYPRYTLKVMKSLSPSSFQKFLNYAVEELFFAEREEEKPPSLRKPSPTKQLAIISRDKKFSGITIERRTWSNILGDLNFFQQALAFLAEFESSYILPLASAELFNRKDGSILKIPLHESIPLQEGMFLSLHERGRSSPVGRLKIELYDKNFLLGKLTEAHGVSQENMSRFYARLRQGPTKHLSLLLENIIATFTKQKTFPSATLNAAFGVEEIQEKLASLQTVSSLDSCQSEAVNHAVFGETPVVLIQGPPGTGKTAVLVEIIHQYCKQGKRIVVTASSNAAVDNICRRLKNIPVLRLGHGQSVAEDVQEYCWSGNPNAVAKFKKQRQGKESVYCGTHVGLIRDELTITDLEKNGLFDVILFDEAGMTRMVEFLLCAHIAQKAVLLGDHCQLPPFPFPEMVVEKLNKTTVALRRQWSGITKSCLEWLIEERGWYAHLLQNSYRCQNPRLLRFSSSMFYHSRVKTSHNAEYYQLSAEKRQKIYPSSTLCCYCTSSLPSSLRKETLILGGKGPGLENTLEAKIIISLFFTALQKYPLEEITMISPYRRQVRLLRSLLTQEKSKRKVRRMTESAWNNFLHTRISTVDSFQGGESDMVIIGYVRSNQRGEIGFIDNPNRVNVAHTRSRKEMIIVGDLRFLKQQSQLFHRLEKAICRDGKWIDLTKEMLEKLGIF